MKSFLFVSAQYLPTVGGVERYTFNLAKRLIEDGHRVTIITSALPDQPMHQVDKIGIEVFRVPSWRLMNGRLPVIKCNLEFNQIAKEIWNKHFDYCLINTYFYPLSMYAAAKCKARKIPAVLVNHGSAWLMTGSKVLEFAGQIYEFCAARFCHLFCKRFFGVSVASQKWMDTFMISAEGIITNAIDPDEVLQGIDQNINWPETLQLPQNRQLIAFVGRMIPEKGVDQMVSAMEEIRRACPNAYLLMAGDGPLYDKYKDVCFEGVHFLGRQPYSSVLALIKEADIFCLPSRSEGFACTVLEAAALRCPIITTATGGSPQLLVNSSYGLLLKDMNSDTIADACIQVLNDPQWRATAVELTEERLINNYTWNTAVEQLYQAFDYHIAE